MNEVDVKRFWSKVDVRGPAECWEWRAAHFRTVDRKQMHGMFQLGGHARRAHRIAYELVKGSIPVGAFICHHCDNMSCVNPAHLYAGDHESNTRDMVARGRQARGDSHGARTKLDRWHRGERHCFRLHPEKHARGERCGTAKLSADQITSILLALQSGERQIDLADRFGVSQAHISRIKLNTAWKHIPRAEAKP